MSKNSQVSEFHDELFKWWEQGNRRELPWRQTNDPYHIMVSEFMLQQTQVNRVVPKYKKFIQTFPELDDLVNAPKSQVIELWQGLGYNRRAVWLHEAAQTITELDMFPKTWQELIKIKGIGPYTSRSIPIFAFNADYAAVDTNIRRIYIYKGWVTEEMSKSEVQKFADKAIPLGSSRDYHNALMDYGSTELSVRKTGIKPRTTQPSFKGSKRQKRGKIISLLVEKGKMNKGDIRNEFNQVKKSNIDKIIQDLANEGLIVVKENQVLLAE